MWEQQWLGAGAGLPANPAPPTGWGADQKAPSTTRRRGPRGRPQQPREVPLPRDPRPVHGGGRQSASAQGVRLWLSRIILYREAPPLLTLNPVGGGFSRQRTASLRIRATASSVSSEETVFIASGRNAEMTHATGTSSSSEIWSRGYVFDGKAGRSSLAARISGDSGLPDKETAPVQCHCQ